MNKWNLLYKLTKINDNAVYESVIVFKFHWILNQWEKHCKNTMSDLYFNEESEENVSWGKYKWQWRLSLYHSSSISVWAWKEKKRVVMKAMRKKLNICTLQLPMIGAYTDIAKTKRGK